MTENVEQPTLTITVGLPASGKTTLATKLVEDDTTNQTIRINRDSIRKMLYNAYWFPEDTAFKERNVSLVQQASVKAALTHNLNVIVDDTNIPLFSREDWENIAKECNAKFQIIFIETNAQECIRRDQDRFERVGDRLVGADVINTMAEKLKIANEQLKNKQ